MYSKHQKKNWPKTYFCDRANKLFETCPLRQKNVSLKVILTGAYTKEEKIAKLKPYIFDKSLVRQIYKELVRHEFSHYVKMPGICEENMLLYIS